MKSCLKYLTALSMLSTASAQTAVWEGTGTATSAGRYWGELANWSGVAEAPVGAGKSVMFNNDFLNASGQRVPLLADASGNDSSITIGNITFSNSTSSNRSYTIGNVSGGSGILIFDSGSSGVTSKISIYTGSGNTQSFNTAIQLDSTLEISVSGPASTTNNLLVFNGSISGVGGLTTSGGNLYRAKLNGANTYTGDTVLTKGQLVVGATGTLGSSDTFVDTAVTLILETNAAFNDDYQLTLQSGTILNLNFTGSDTLAGLTIGGSALAAGTYDATALSSFGVTATGTGSFTIAAIPEPSTAALLVGLSAVGLALARREGRKD